MKIYGSTQYVNNEDPYLQLSVISQWDWSTKTICYGKLLDGTVIRYSLNQHNPWKILTPEDITEEMKEELVNMGYELK